MDFSHIPPINDFIDAVTKDPTLKHLAPQTLKNHIKSYIKTLKTKTDSPPTKPQIIKTYIQHLKTIFTPPIKPMINATGILLHTNLGRAPLSREILQTITENNSGYTNIEYDLQNSTRAYRDDFLKDIFHFVTGSEDTVIVNNNAAAIYLITKALAQNKKIIISRGELVEIGGSFRIPDMLTDAGAILTEVGTTNCTRITDYEKAIDSQTAFILKVHTSNFTITGHTETPSLTELVALAKKQNIPLIYDAGSGLLKKPKSLFSRRDTIYGVRDITEPDITECIESGVDIVCFSGDKLLGGMQAGIILGKSQYLKPLKKHPLMRVLRSDKLTISYIYHNVALFASEQQLLQKNKVYALLSQSTDRLKKKAKRLSDLLTTHKINNKISPSNAQIGGGSLPYLQIPSYEIQIDVSSPENLHYHLLSLDKPILTILRGRKLYLDVFTLDETDFKYIAQSLRC